MPETPDIDNTPEEIPVPEASTSADTVGTLTTEQSTETLTSGTDNPQPQIETKIVNLIEVLNRLQNLAVETFFTPIPDEDPTLAEQRTYFKTSLTIDTEADNITTAFAKLYALDRFQGLDTGDLAKVYGIPIENFAEKVVFMPQICLMFRELSINQNDLPLRDYKLKKEISFRLLGDNKPQSYDDLIALREKILDSFRGYSYDVSSENTFNYRDLDKGYRFAIDIEKEKFTELMTKVLAIQNDTYDEKFVGTSKVNRPLTAPKGTALGKVINLPFRGRFGTVVFWKAEFKQMGIEDKIIATNQTLDMQ